MAQQITVRGEGGFVFLMDLPLPPEIKKRIDEGALTVISGRSLEEPPVDQGVEAAKPDVAQGLEEPALYAPKPEWIAYAVQKGVDSEEARTLTKEQLIQRVRKGS